MIYTSSVLLYYNNLRLRSRAGGTKGIQPTWIHALTSADRRWIMRLSGSVPLTGSSRKRWALSLKLTLCRFKPFAHCLPVLAKAVRGPYSAPQSPNHPMPIPCGGGIAPHDDCPCCEVVGGGAQRKDGPAVPTDRTVSYRAGKPRFAGRRVPSSGDALPGDWNHPTVVK